MTQAYSDPARETDAHALPGSWAVYEEAIFGRERSDPHVRRVVLSLHRTLGAATRAAGENPIAHLRPKGERPGWERGDTPDPHYWSESA